MVQGYIGARKSGKTTYFLSVLVRWDSSKIVVFDSSLLLNQATLTRKIFSSGVFSDFSSSYIYENSFGQKEELKMNKLDSNYVNIGLSGTITIPFIYVV